ncbi:hypothetical protein [Mesorhizobium sp. M4B.F.Ca.ET.013.02.1.1]|uniref:hypothetical protein n=1 Tax=Mesorhizobium sp. M4B.F.Ca.ET.013.02.1.1 TaxID=2496755 RepID=UPI000FD2EDBA|nr:hypothetical protein [Mesorhizobium sp. M4B.F.Ca.ET.013.02.1.1]RUW26944.1 hypothetical protein EOA34_06580 [Mesorhizobium sp. M4B.F.Ca.ET.013.02.1.1]
MMTDGAVYDRDHVLLTVKRKVTVSEKLPLAVAFRGNFAFAEVTSRQIIRAAEEVGFDRMLAALEGDLPNMPQEPRLEILIAGVSETAGPMHRMFTNWEARESDRQKCSVLLDPGPMHFGFGSDGRAVTLDDFGIPPPRQGETIQSWLSRYGVAIFEYFRRLPVPIDPFDVSTAREYLIGGICDMTVVKPSSVSTTLLHRWPDKIGERIDPFRDIEKTREAA